MTLILTLLISSIIGFAQVDATTCPRTITYDGDANTIYLTEGDTRLMPLDAPEMIDFSLGRFSPDCQYVTTTIWYRPRIGDTVVWVFNTGTRIGIFERSVLIPHPVQWSPDSTRLIVSTESGSFLWNPWTNQRTPLIGRSVWLNASVSWLPETEQIVAHSTTLTGSTINIHDWHTGTIVESYTLDIGFRYARYGFKLDQNSRYVIIFGNNLGGISVWDRQTGAEYMLDSGSQGARSESHIAISSDGRFLVRMGYYLSIWDLHNLREDRRANVITDHPLTRRCRTVAFIDPQTIEAGCQSTYYFNASTGELIEQ